MPLDSLNDHIEFIIGQIDQWKSSSVVYPAARKSLIASAENHKNGLRIIQNILRRAIVAPATNLQQQLEEKGKKINVEDIIRKHWINQVAGCYSIIERLNFDFNNQVSTIMPFETYYWIQSIFKDIGVSVTVILEASNQFLTQSFHEKILDPLLVGLELGEGVKVPGTLTKINVMDVVKGFKISEGYVINYIRGETKNIQLWPILVHESFHVADREKGIVNSVTRATKTFPILNPETEINKKHIREIFVDILSVEYFGPMYLLSLVNYYERLPYVQTIDHPEMTLRLRAVQEYLKKTQVQYTDIYDKCKDCCIQLTEDKIKGILESNNFSDEKEQKIIMIYDIVSRWFAESGIMSFRMLLKQYLNETSEEKYKANEKKDKIFTDPLYTFNEIADLVFDGGVSLALDPRILINVVLAQYHRYVPEKHFEIITDSIVKWKIRKEWIRTVESL